MDNHQPAQHSLFAFTVSVLAVSLFLFSVEVLVEVGPCLLLLGLGSSLVVIAVSLRLVVLPDFTGMWKIIPKGQP